MNTERPVEFMFTVMVIKALSINVFLWVYYICGQCYCYIIYQCYTCSQGHQYIKTKLIFMWVKNVQGQGHYSMINLRSNKWILISLRKNKHEKKQFKFIYISIKTN